MPEDNIDEKAFALACIQYQKFYNKTNMTNALRVAIMAYLKEIYDKSNYK